MVVIDRIVCEIKSQVKVAHSITDSPCPYELVGSSLLDSDQPTPYLGALMLIVVKVSWNFFTMVVTRTLVGCEFFRAEFLLSRLQIWQHAEVAFVKVAIAVN